MDKTLPFAFAQPCPQDHHCFEDVGGGGGGKEKTW